MSHCSLLSRVLGLSVAITIAACRDATGPTPVGSIDLGSARVDIDEGQSAQLVATPRAGDGAALTDRALTWTSSDQTTVTVSAIGLVTGVRDGQATVTAMSEGKTSSVTVVVTGRPATIVVTASRTSLNEGETVDLSAVVTSQKGTTLTRPLTWTSSDAAIATVATTSGVARVTGAGHGSVTIRATLEGVTASVALSVRGNVARIDLSRLRLDVVSGQGAVITAQTWSSNNVLLTDRTVTATATAPTIATVDAAFKVTATSPGTATITFRSEQASATLTVAVHRILLGEIGVYHTCAVVEDIDTYCWGQNGGGELGIGSLAQRTSPERVVTSAQFVALYGQQGATAGRTASGAYYTWGGSYGTSSMIPIEASYMSGLTGLVAGANFACGIAPDTKTYCWGNNQAGQLGNGSSVIFTASPAVPVSGPTFTKLFTESTASRACGIEANGTAWCWGSNVLGALGDLTQQDRWVPVRVQGGFLFSQLAAAVFVTCGQTTTLELRCWGGGDGNWLPTSVPSPRLIASGVNFVRITAGIWHFCGLTPAGDAYCWGNTNRGALGDGTAIPRAVPTLVAGGHKWVSIAAGGDHTCAVTDTGRLFCWGENTSGELGIGSFSNIAIPIEVRWPVLR